MKKKPAKKAKPKKSAKVMPTKVPTGAKIIAVLHGISAGASILLGLIALIVGGVIFKLVASSVPKGLLAGFGAALLVVLLLVFLINAVLNGFVAWGLWKGHKWAWIVSIVLWCIAILGAISSLLRGQFGSIVNLVIAGAIAGYLIFNKDVKAAYLKH